eukprot:7820915-Alexandrium_andersonii.AAC.1
MEVRPLLNFGQRVPQSRSCFNPWSVACGPPAAAHSRPRSVRVSPMHSSEVAAWVQGQGRAELGRHQ